MAYRNKEEEKLERREENERTGAGQAPQEKQKKTWREVDAGRDGARNRSGGRDGDKPRTKGESPAYKAYKSKLGRLFDEGGPVQPTVVETVRATSEKAPLLPKAPPAEPVVLSPREQLQQATTAEAVTAAAHHAMSHGGLPLDALVLEKVLALSDETLLGAALEALLDTMEKGRPKNAKALVARLAELHLQDPHFADLAKGIRSRLGG